MTDNTPQHPRLTPLAVCLRVIGPEAKIAAILGYHRTAPFTWARKAAHRSAGDLPSARIQRLLLAYCVAKGLPMQPEWLIWGAPASEIDAALAAATPASAA